MTPDWTRFARCAETDPEAFFPDTGGDQPRHTVETVRRTCADCPVQYECLLEALAVPDTYGTWAGTTRHIRKQLPRGNPCGPAPALRTGWQVHAARRHLNDGRSHRWVAVAMSVTVEAIRALVEEHAA